MKWFITGLLLLLFTLAGALAGAPQANATSQYDNALVTWSSSDLRWGSTVVTTQDFGNMMTSMSLTSACSPTIRDEIVNHVSAGGNYAIVQDRNANTGVFGDDNGISIYIDKEEPYFPHYFTTTSVQGNLYSSGNNQGGLYFRLYRFEGQARTQCGTISSYTLSNNNTSYPYPSRYLVEYRGFNLDYPPDYAGQTLNPKIEYSSFKPKFYVSGAVKWKASIHDTNFNTIDEVPFKCNGDLAPVLHYELWNMNVTPEIKLSEGFFNATAQIDYQFPESSLRQNYRVVGWYDCGSDDPLQFNQSSFFDFSINGTGMLHVVGLESCLIDGFPFVDIESCLVGLNSTLALLAFQASNPVNDGLANTATDANPEGCYTLGTLGDWINRPNQVICPAFSSTVRTVVTPFVTVVLAMVVFYYISRGRGVILE